MGKLQEAVADYSLTIAELNALVSAGHAMVGAATFFEHEIHPSGGPANVPHIETHAYGKLPDGRRFQYHVAGGDQSSLIKSIKIVFE